jgi:hypothetical protein
VPGRLGTIDAECDAPLYATVQASAEVGIVTPGDVRCCRLSRFPSRQAWWETVLVRGPRSVAACSCGEALPELVMHLFTLYTGEVVPILLGQCGQCHTVFWE